MSFCAKSSNQGTFQRGDQAVHRRVRLSKTYTYRVSCWNIKQSRTFLECNQAIKVNFCESKILIPFANGYLQALWKWLPLIYCILEFISVSGTDTLVTTYENFVSYRDYQSLSIYGHMIKFTSVADWGKNSEVKICWIQFSRVTFVIMSTITWSHMW